MPSPATYKRILRDYGVSLALWTFLAFLMAWQNARLASLENVHWTLREMAIFFGPNFFTFAIFTPPIFYLVERWPVHAGHFLTRTVTYVAGYAPFLLAFATIRWAVYSPWIPVVQRLVGPKPQTQMQVVYEMFADLFGVYIAILLAAHAYAYFLNLQRQEREQFELKQALTQTQLQVLRNQMQPHFLFNTLHGIRTLVSSDPELAQKMILNLSNLLRRSARANGADLVPLEDDLEFAQAYLGIEKMRLGERLEVRWDIQPGTRQLLVPQFLLQPLLENAIKHGIACSPQGGWMEMSSAQHNGTLRVRVTNSVGADSVPVPRGGGVGLSNMHARLEYLYGGEAELSFIVERGVATAALRLPEFSTAAGSRHLL